MTAAAKPAKSWMLIVFSDCSNRLSIVFSDCSNRLSIKSKLPLSTSWSFLMSTTVVFSISTLPSKLSKRLFTPSNRSSMRVCMSPKRASMRTPSSFTLAVTASRPLSRREGASLPTSQRAVPVARTSSCTVSIRVLAQWTASFSRSMRQFTCSEGSAAARTTGRERAKLVTSGRWGARALRVREVQNGPADSDRAMGMHVRMQRRFTHSPCVWPLSHCNIVFFLER
jgi:hypothetical protein